MSLHGLQTAVAAIIRHPRAKYEWKSEFLDTFDLNPQERRVVEKLSRHEELNKYGRDQANARIEVMLNHCVRIPSWVPDRVLKNIWMDLYEPASIYNESDLKGRFESSIAFSKFLLANKDARKRLKRSAPYFIFDLIAFEIAELELSRPILVDPPLCENSPLIPSFRIVDLEFDIPKWLRDVENENLNEFEREMTLVFVRDRPFFPRIF